MCVCVCDYMFLSRTLEWWGRGRIGGLGVGCALKVRFSLISDWNTISGDVSRFNMNTAMVFLLHFLLLMSGGKGVRHQRFPTTT